jgi:hypothetical protein
MYTPIGKMHMYGLTLDRVTLTLLAKKVKK